MKEKNIQIRTFGSLNGINNNKRFCDIVLVEGELFLEIKQAKNRIRMSLKDFMYQVNIATEVLQ